MNSVLAVERKMRDLKLTDQQVFCSPSYESYLRTLLRYPSEIIHRKPPRITIHYAPERAPAYIVGSHIHVNFGSSIFKSYAKNRAQLARLITGLVVHEFGHYRFTDSAGMETAISSLFEHQKWFPKLPAEMEDDLEFNRAEFEAFMTEYPQRVPLAKQAWHTIMNILEDAYIEESLYRVMSGILLDGLNYLRYHQRKSIPSLTDMLSHISTEGYDMFSCVSDLLLSYAKFGLLKYDWRNEEESKSLPIQWIRRIAPYVDPILTEGSTTKRITAINLTFLALWPIIKDHVMSVPEFEDGSLAKSESTSMAPDAASSAPSSGGTRSKATPVSDDEDTGASGSRKTRRKTAKRLGYDLDSETGSKKDSKDDIRSSGAEPDDGVALGEGETDEEKDSSALESEPKDKAGCVDGDEDTTIDSDDSDGSSTAEEDESAEEAAPNPDTDSSLDDAGDEAEPPEHDLEREPSDDDGEVSMPDDEGYFSEEDAEESFDYGEIMSSLRSLEKELKHEIAVDEVSDELISELAREAAELDYGVAHRGVGVRTVRVKHVSDKAISTFEEVYAPIKPTVDEMVRRVTPLLKKRGEADLPMGGFYTGSRFDATRLVLNDWRYFRTNSTPLPDNRTAVSVLIDESGSMGGTRISMARIAAIALYMFCNALDIKCSVIGHNESFSRPTLELQIYSDFESPDKLDKFRLLNICARENNRDGAAALFAGEHLLKRSEKTKIMFVISDGAPLASGYSGVAAQTDLANIIAELRRKGIIIFAAAIGSDKEAIHRIYGDGFLDITDVRTLPNQLLFWLRRYLMP